MPESQKNDAPLPSKIGFPENTLAESPLRLDVLEAKRGVFAVVDKPADILMDSYLGAPKVKSAILALKSQIGKGELERLGMESPFAVNQVDFEISGVSILAMNRDIANDMRNAMWSDKFEFEYIFLCKAAKKNENSFELDLPILMHEERPVWIVSHRFGKKAKTAFQFIEDAGGYQLWKAKTSTIRPHQTRVHAAEGGLNIVGEWLYSKTPYIFLSKLKDEYKLGKGVEDETSLYPHLMLHLSRTAFDCSDFGKPELGKIEAVSPLPKGFKTCLKKLGFKTCL